MTKEAMNRGSSLWQKTRRVYATADRLAEKVTKEIIYTAGEVIAPSNSAKHIPEYTTTETEDGKFEIVLLSSELITSSSDEDKEEDEEATDRVSKKIITKNEKKPDATDRIVGLETLAIGSEISHQVALEIAQRQLQLPPRKIDVFPESTTPESAALQQGVPDGNAAIFLEQIHLEDQGTTQTNILAVVHHEGIYEFRQIASTHPPKDKTPIHKQDKTQQAAP